MNVAMASEIPAPISPETVWTNRGRLKVTNLPAGESSYAAWMHLFILTGVLLTPIAWVIPVLMWSARRKRSPFLDDHGREIINFCFTLFVVCLGISMFFGAGLILVAVWVIALIAVIRGAIAASHAEYYRYPATVRLV